MDRALDRRMLMHSVRMQGLELFPDELKCLVFSLGWCAAVVASEPEGASVPSRSAS